MTKRNRIIYWIATVWLSLGMLSTAIVQLLQPVEEVQKMEKLGYLPYFMTILGAWKVLGVIAVLVPRFPLVKEWAYAGFFFTATGAILSHLFMNGVAMDYFGPSLLLVLTLVSWYFRPADRRIIPLNV